MLKGSLIVTDIMAILDTAPILLSTHFNLTERTINGCFKFLTMTRSIVEYNPSYK